jgi:quercetin dioxygenase-like cupin family protein
VSFLVVVPAGGGEVVGDSADRRVEILSDHQSLAATWSRFGPRREGADLHVHRSHTDLFYVLRGEMTVRLGIEDRTVVAPQGTLARVPPLVVHGFRNGTDAELRYLNFHAPGSDFAAYMRALRDGRTFAFDQYAPPADGGQPASEAVVGDAAGVFEREGLQVRLLADVEEIAIAEVRAGRAKPSHLHVHQRHVESLYVLEGRLAVAGDDGDVVAHVGSWVQIHPGVAHALSSDGTGGVRFLDVHTPNCEFRSFLRREDAAFDQTPA